MQDGSDPSAPTGAGFNAFGRADDRFGHDHRMVPWPGLGMAGNKCALGRAVIGLIFATVSTLFFVQHFQRFAGSRRHPVQAGTRVSINGVICVSN